IRDGHVTGVQTCALPISIGRSLALTDIAGNDIVHGDLHPGNLLQLDGRLSAVIDMDYTRVGDADFDLAMLAVASLEIGVDSGVQIGRASCRERLGGEVVV